MAIQTNYTQTAAVPTRTNIPTTTNEATSSSNTGTINTTTSSANSQQGICTVYTPSAPNTNTVSETTTTTVAIVTTSPVADIDSGSVKTKTTGKIPEFATLEEGKAYAEKMVLEKYLEFLNDPNYAAYFDNPDTSNYMPNMAFEDLEIKCKFVVDGKTYVARVFKASSMHRTLYPNGHVTQGRSSSTSGSWGTEKPNILFDEVKDGGLFDYSKYADEIAEYKKTGTVVIDGVDNYGKKYCDEFAVQNIVNALVQENYFTEYPASFKFISHEDEGSITLKDGTVLYPEREYVIDNGQGNNGNGLSVVGSSTTPLKPRFTGVYYDDKGNKYDINGDPIVEKKYKFPDLINTTKNLLARRKTAASLGYTKTACDGVYSQTLANGKTVYYVWNPVDGAFERKNDIASINKDGTYVDRNGKSHSSYNDQWIQASIGGYTPTVEEGLFYKNGVYYDYNESTGKFERVDISLYEVVDEPEV